MPKWSHAANSGSSLREALTLLEPHWPGFVALISRFAEAGFPRSLARRAAHEVLTHLGGELDTYDTSALAGS